MGRSDHMDSWIAVVVVGVAAAWEVAWTDCFDMDSAAAVVDRDCCFLVDTMIQIVAAAVQKEPNKTVA